MSPIAQLRVFIRKTLLAPSALVLLLCGSSTAGAVPFWTIEGERGTVHLLGSVHFGDESFYPLPEAVERAFANADVLIVEADTTQLDAVALQNAVRQGYYPPGETLRDHVSAELWAELQAFLHQHGLSDALIVQQKPVLAALTISNHLITQQGWRAELGVDRHFLIRAHQRGMPVRELEGLAWQFEWLLALQPDTLLLEQSLREAQQIEAGLTVLMEAWRRADEEALAHYFIDEPLREGPEFEAFIEHMIFARNRQMAARISEYLHQESGTWFVVVGAGHLVGEQGIPALLNVSAPNSDTGR